MLFKSINFKEKQSISSKKPEVTRIIWNNTNANKSSLCFLKEIIPTIHAKNAVKFLFRSTDNFEIMVSTIKTGSGFFFLLYYVELTRRLLKVFINKPEEH